VLPEPDERLEYAPTRGRRHEGRDVLKDAFGRSAAQMLASDVRRDERQTQRARRRNAFDRGIDLER
jgi:hypothetical protein